MRLVIGGHRTPPGPMRIEVATVSPASLPRARWPQLAALLSAEERARAARLRRPGQRHAYVAAHALKRLMLSDMAGGAPQAWRFATGSAGKPVVAGRPGPHFNLSHTDGLVACALCEGVPVGIDVERVHRPAPLEVASACFAPQEQAWLSGLPDARRTRGFYRLWTLKEAVVKAQGEGLSPGMQAFAIGFDPLRVTFPGPAPSTASAWRLVQQAVGPSHLLALAWCGAEAAVTLRPDRLRDDPIA
ncbi:4'-phosphopantetheinyl transferase family protein [Sphingomonas sp. NCPPB 2930]